MDFTRGPPTLPTHRTVDISEACVLGGSEVIFMEDSTAKHRTIFQIKNTMRISNAWSQIAFLTGMASLWLSLTSGKLNTALKLRDFAEEMGYNFCPFLPRHCTVWPHRSMTRPVIMGSQMSSCLSPF